jgi:hypothetical protein
MTTARIDAETTTAAPTSYTIRSKESFQRSRLWPVTVILVPIVVAAAAAAANDSFGSEQSATVLLQRYFDKAYRDNDSFALAGAGAFVAIAVFLCHRLVSKRNQIVEVDLTLTVLPLGVQRSKTTTTTYNENANHRTNDVFHYPLLPIETVRDCILLEHIGGFSVTTHVMLRLNNFNDTGDGEPKDGSKTGPTSSGLVEAFPGANLTFDQCQSLVNQIGRALEEVQ